MPFSHSKQLTMLEVLITSSSCDDHSKHQGRIFDYQDPEVKASVDIVTDVTTVPNLKEHFHHKKETSFPHVRQKIQDFDDKLTMLGKNEQGSHQTFDIHTYILSLIIYIQTNKHGGAIGSR